jgi:hypothetical protein
MVLNDLFSFNLEIFCLLHIVAIYNSYPILIFAGEIRAYPNGAIQSVGSGHDK